MTKLIPVEPKEQEQLAATANEIWHECFPGIISEGQIEYMIERFQSLDAMQRQIADEGYEYYWITDEVERLGYTAIKPEPEERRLFLSKLYLRASNRGKGHASAAIDRLRELCAEKGWHTIWLTVNRGNSRAVDTYLHKGFTIAREQCVSIGEGYYMDDYVMELEV